jgi:ABC-type Fe3+/spermidine/putrescine transport system ATPase subunit
MSSIVFDRVAKTYDKTPVVRGIDLEIQSGEFVVILGPSGCGKSTLLRMVAGLEAISGVSRGKRVRLDHRHDIAHAANIANRLIDNTRTTMHFVRINIEVHL